MKPSAVTGRLAPAVLALAAVALLCLAGVHAHHPDDHSGCWLCTASVGHFAIAIAPIVLTVIWTFLSKIATVVWLATPIQTIPERNPRAPPARANA